MNLNKEINKIAFPLLANSILGLLMGFVNQAMIGRISAEAFGAIGIVNSLLFTVVGILGAVSVAFHIHGARSNGRNDAPSFQGYFLSALLLDTLIGISFMVILLLFQRPLLIFVYHFEGDILEYAVQYLSIMSAYVPLQLLLFTLSSFFKITKDTKWIFIGSTITSVMNVCLNYLLIFGNFGFPRLEVKGAAIATIVSLSLNVLIYFYLCRKHLKVSFLRLKRYMEHMSTLLKESLPLVGQELIEGSIFIIGVEGIVARIGNLELSSYVLVMQVVSIILIPMHMYASAIITLISEKYTLGESFSLKIIPRIAYKIIMILFGILTFVFMYFRGEVIGFLSADKQLIAYASSIFFVTILVNLLNPLQNVYKSALQAVGQSDFVLFTTFAVNVCAFCIMLLLCFGLAWRLNGVLVGMFINYVLLSIIFTLKYRKLIG